MRGDLWCGSLLRFEKFQAAPAVPAGDRGVGAPGGADFLGLGFRGEIGEGVEVAHGGADAEVADGEDVGAAEGEHEEHLRGPAADSFDLDEFGDHRFVVFAADLVQGDAAIDGGRGEVVEEVRFIAREADAAELIVRERGDVFGKQLCFGECDEAIANGQRGLRGKLLRDDREGEHLETVAIGFQPIWADLADQRADDGVGALEVCRGGLDDVALRGHAGQSRGGIYSVEGLGAG